MNSQRPSLSLVLIVRNEERCLARCLSSVQSVVDEIVVVDTGSTDGTMRIAQAFKARIAHFTWCDDFAAARNYALAQSTGDWLLVLDADEHASAPLAQEIAEFIRGQPAVGRLRIVSEFKRNGRTLNSQAFVSRLFPRGARFEGRIHEQLISPLHRVNLKGELWHDGYLETQKTSRNVRLLERELERSPNSAYLLFQLALEYTSLDQPDKAFICLQKAFLVAGPQEAIRPNVVVDFLYAIINTARFDLGFDVIERTAAGLEDFPDFHFVCGLFYLNAVRSNPAKHIAHLGKIEQSFLRCLALGESDKYKSVRGTGSFLAHYNLGNFYEAFGDEARARQCFEKAAQVGYAPAADMLRRLAGTQVLNP